ncbi:elongation factor P--(R)-beta-lysine ligase [Buchnera aphidicola (Chaitoregma tattakana)]|uniref:elongation factor P--(R)-beta-lysine ligase n=1 Tax=Buchnera aphidicola TaxID=9 RepID=UPI0031B810E2
MYNILNSKIKKTNLIYRSKIIFKIRKFFNEIDILEVDTPLLSRHTVTDCYIKCFKTSYYDIKTNNNINLWLTSSPEYHMKRLLSLKIGSIFQICHSFRNEAYSSCHNPEFTMLELYMVKYNMFELMKFIDVFFQNILNFQKSDMISYRKIFIKFLKIDPLTSNKDDLVNKIIFLNHYNLIKNNNLLNKKDLLEILFMIGIEKKLGKKRPIFIYHFPADQALLSSLNKYDKRTSNRFEIFFKGIELANGFQELTDRKEQEQRFKNENILRNKMGLKKIKLDKFFLDALSKGIPECSGVSVGIDRIIMLKLKSSNIFDILPFSIHNC